MDAMTSQCKRIRNARQNDPFLPPCGRGMLFVGSGTQKEIAVKSTDFTAIPVHVGNSVREDQPLLQVKRT